MSRNRGKRKGNQYENKMSKILSKWIYGDEYVLGRTRLSGAIKHMWRGDVCPQKPLPSPWTGFPFHIELKYGYKDNIPTLANISIIIKWISNLLNDATELQPILFLICRFHRLRGDILISSIEFKDIDYNIIIRHIDNYFIVYKLDDLLKYNFLDIVKWEDIKLWISDQSEIT